MISTLRRKFIMVNMICVTLILTAVFTAIFMINTTQLEEESVQTLERALDFSERRIIGDYNIDEGDPKHEYEATNFVIRFGYDGTPRIVSANNVNVTMDIGTIMPTSTAEDIFSTVKENYNEGVTSGEFKNYKLRYETRENLEGIDVAFVDLTSEYSQKKQMFIACLLAGIVAMSGFFLVSVLLSKWALRPVEKAWENQKRFAADASHELKTPLTVILANMEILKSNKKDKIENQMDWVDNTEAEATRMKHLANNLLFLAKNGDMKKPKIVDKVNLSDVVTKSALAFEPVAFEKKIAIDIFIESDLYAGGDENQIRQLMSILLDNAIKYSYDDTTITVSLKEVSGKSILEVNNTGVPIATEDLTNIFERFYRSDKSRSEEGYGLGLSIAKNIADQHKAAISAKSDEENGTTFTVIFPVYRA